MAQHSSVVGTPPVVTVTLFGFERRERPWAFAQMALARRFLRAVPGLRFHRQLGSGRGDGFDIRPDFSRYALLAVWNDRAAADAFHRESPFMASYRRHSAECWRVALAPVRAHGAWSGSNPFVPVADTPPEGPVAVLTRATIRPSRLRAFWQAVPGTSSELALAQGRIASIGVGELPFIRQATLSFWHSEQAVVDFAYRSPRHREVVRRTRAEGWYSEELFARFAVLHSEGCWHGVDPLASVVPEHR